MCFLLLIHLDCRCSSHRGPMAQGMCAVKRRWTAVVIFILAAEPPTGGRRLPFFPRRVAAMSAILENLKYDPNGSQLQQHEDLQSSEGKFGIPRYAGEPTGLQEYTFRIRTRILKEKAMEASEVKKLGPLGLRMVEGLRGPALRLAQQIAPEKLATGDGPEMLIKHFHANLKPRRAQEARELFAAGSRDGGVLSRQLTEPMSSYVMRRRAWWAALQDLDPDMQMSESLLAESLLANAGISEDQKLMVRTMLQGKSTYDAVAEELLAQHPRVHERERHQRHGSHKGFGRGTPWKRFNHKGHPRSFMSEWPEEESVDEQSLSGYTAAVAEWEEDESGHHESYEAVVDYELDYEDPDTFFGEHVGLLAAQGFDFENERAVSKLRSEVVPMKPCRGAP